MSLCSMDGMVVLLRAKKSFVLQINNVNSHIERLNMFFVVAKTFHLMKKKKISNT